MSGVVASQWSARLLALGVATRHSPLATLAALVLIMLFIYYLLVQRTAKHDSYEVGEVCTIDDDPFDPSNGHGVVEDGDV